MSSALGGSESWSNLAALAWMVVVVWVFGVGGLLFVVMDLVGIFEFQRRMTRLICLVSDLVMVGRSLVLSTPVGGWAIGHMFWARRCIFSMALIASVAALSM
jgi:hypothetical protein